MTDDPELLRPLLELFNASSKGEARKLASAMVLDEGALASVIVTAQAGLLDDYRHFAYFDHSIPKHLAPLPHERAALTKSDVGLVTDPAALKLLRRTRQAFRERKFLCVHLFAAASRQWHMFHFRQQDLDEHQPHWVGGRHLHYTSDLFVNRTAQEVWEQVHADGAVRLSGVHIRTAGGHVPSRVGGEDV